MREFNELQVRENDKKIAALNESTKTQIDATKELVNAIERSTKESTKTQIDATKESTKTQIDATKESTKTQIDATKELVNAIERSTKESIKASEARIDSILMKFMVQNKQIDNEKK